uniref:Uncharacterized protein n=1 Tax=Zea mays TaxID=4577 RepID=C0PAE3_MAIZE|nr:unknown [Zea mays]
MLNRAHFTSRFYLDSRDSIPPCARRSCWHRERTIDSVNMRRLHIRARDRRLIRSELCLSIWGRVRGAAVIAIHVVYILRL